MRKARLVEAILIAVLLGLMLYAVQATWSLQQYVGGETILGAGNPDKHYVVITDDTNTVSWKIFLEGLREESQKKNAVVEVSALRSDYTLEELNLAFQRIQLSRVDGVWVKLKNNQAAKEGIQALHNGGVRVMTVSNDCPESQRDAYVGTNRYELGRATAGIVKSINKIPARVLLILGPEYTQQGGAASNSYLNGIHDYNLQYSGIASLQTAFSGERRAELIMAERLDHDPVDVVICTDPIDSIRVTRILIDRNRIGTVKVIASGDMPEIVDYILKKTIQVSVLEDYKTLGIQSANAMDALVRKSRQSGYISIPIRIMDAQNAPR